MSKKEIVKVKFNFTFAKLKQLADGMLILIDRDITEFNDRGFTVDKRTQFVDAIDKFANFPTDEQMDGIKITATAEKNVIRNAVEKRMRTFLLAAKIVFGEDTGAYREFGNPDLTHQTDAELVRNANMMVDTATKYLSELSTEGITAAKVALLDSEKTTFDNAIDFQQNAINNRDNSTEQRANYANSLYDLLVKYSEIGKDIWYDVSESKYNDYIIYNTPTGENDTLGENEYAGNIAPNTLLTITTVDEDAIFILSNNGTVPLDFYLSDTEAVSTFKVTVAAGASVTKTTAEMSPDGDGVYLLVKNTSTITAGNYSVLIEY